MAFIFCRFGPTSDKLKTFNTDCKSVYLYDQIKEVAATSTETFARSKDAHFRQALAELETLITAHKRREPRKPEEAHVQTSTSIVTGDVVNDDTFIDPFQVELDNWQAELERLESLQELRKRQTTQLLAGLAGFRGLNTPEAEVELREDGKDVVPFPLKTQPLMPAR